MINNTQNKQEDIQFEYSVQSVNLAFTNTRESNPEKIMNGMSLNDGWTLDKVVMAGKDNEVMIMIFRRPKI